MITHSAKKLIFVLIFFIFFGELLIMSAFTVVPPIPTWIQTILDPALLAIFCAPILYKYVFQPMSKHISEQNKTEEILRVAAAVFETHDAIMITDVNANIMRVNPAFEKITGYSEAEAIGKNPSFLKSGLHDKNFYKEMWDELLKVGVWSGELWDRKKNGEIYPKQSTITAVKNKEGETVQYVAVFRNIAERKKAEDEIYNLAFYDSLTSLPNRRLLLDRLNVALASSDRTRQYGAILLLDLDRFKTINDSFGHECGDTLLIHVANRLKFSIREADTVARLGGDEFVVMLENLSSNEESAAQKVGLIAENLRSVLAAPYQLNETILHNSPSIGVSLFYGNNEPIDELMRRADMAMYQAKTSGRNKVQFYDPQIQKLIEIKNAMESDLYLALRDNQLELYYQIQLDKNRLPLGAEALIRWTHPQRGLVSPGEFIPLAEKSALIIEIGNWVLNRACQQIALWDENELTKSLVIAINISPRQFIQPDFVERLEALLHKYQIDGSRLKLELTEGVVLDDLDVIVKKMLILKHVVGVTLSLDDFGTGYSSLSYLKQLPLDQIKIDQSFVRNMTTDSSDEMMVKNIIDMAHNFGFNVIAEGVETEAQLELLKKNGCMSYQGYLFSKPIPADQFEILLNNSQWSLTTKLV